MGGRSLKKAAGGHSTKTIEVVATSSTGERHQSFESTGQVVGGVELGSVQLSMPEPRGGGASGVPARGVPARGLPAVSASAPPLTDSAPRESTSAERPSSFGLGTAASRAMGTALGVDAGSLAVRGRRASQEELMRVFDFSHGDKLVRILVDLTRYEFNELASQAVGLLVRQFEQRATLMRAARRMQLMVRPRMIASHAYLEEVMQKLQRLAARRRLYDHELYEATYMLSDLTVHCYDHHDEEGGVHGEGPSPAGRRSGASGSQMTGKSRRVTSVVARSKALELDSSNNTFLALVGLGQVTKGDKQVSFTEIGLGGGSGSGSGTDGSDGDACRSAAAVLRSGSMVVICGAEYRVSKVDDGSGSFWLERGYEGETSSQAAPAWVQLKRRIAEPDHDIQLLLSRLGTAEVVLKLLQLPFDGARVRPEERRKRALLCGAYRLLKAMCNEFPLAQSELSKHLGLFELHTEAKLVEQDISPPTASSPSATATARPAPRSRPRW